MKSNKKFCQKCGADLGEAKIKHCPACGTKIKKSILKKWWFWVIIALSIIIIGSASGGNTDGNTEQGNNDNTGTANNNVSTPVEYEIIDLQKMFDDLDANALKAESTYQNKHVEITVKIKSFDSDGKYISVEPQNADQWNFETALCYIKNDSQLEFLMEKSVGDIVTIKGKVKSVGEVLGYYINIDEIN